MAKLGSDSHQTKSVINKDRFLKQRKQNFKQNWEAFANMCKPLQRFADMDKRY